MADENTPDSSFGHLVNLLAPIAALATRSDDVKHIAQKLRRRVALPWAALVLTAIGFYAALVWYYRWALGRSKAWATWFNGLMPRNRSA